MNFPSLLGYGEFTQSICQQIVSRLDLVHKTELVFTTPQLKKDHSSSPGVPSKHWWTRKLQILENITSDQRCNWNCLTSLVRTLQAGSLCSRNDQIDFPYIWDAVSLSLHLRSAFWNKSTDPLAQSISSSAQYMTLHKYFSRPCSVLCPLVGSLLKPINYGSQTSRLVAHGALCQQMLEQLCLNYSHVFCCFELHELVKRKSFREKICKLASVPTHIQLKQIKHQKTMFIKWSFLQLICRYFHTKFSNVYWG